MLVWKLKRIIIEISFFCYKKKTKLCWLGQYKEAGFKQYLFSFQANIAISLLLTTQNPRVRALTRRPLLARCPPPAARARVGAEVGE